MMLIAHKMITVNWLRPHPPTYRGPVGPEAPGCELYGKYENCKPTTPDGHLLSKMDTSYNVSVKINIQLTFDWTSWIKYETM